MGREFRIDRTSLRKPERTPQGFLRVEGFASRCGVFEYLNEDGTTRRELRLPEEVFSPSALSGFEAAILTDGHPDAPVTAQNVRRVDVGHVIGTARRDGDHVATSILVTDPRVIAKIERGDTGLSVGYSIDLDETPGMHPTYGRYDAIQRNLVINHLAVAVEPRAGDTARIRLDGVRVATRSDGTPKLTTAADGHQHLIDLAPSVPFGPFGPSNETSWAVAEGAANGHSHAWVREADGTITIAESAGHTHAILDDARWSAVRADGEIARQSTASKDAHMADTTEHIHEKVRLQALRADSAEKLAEEQKAKLDDAEAATSKLKAELEIAHERIKALEAQIEAGTAAVTDEAVKEQTDRADAAERKVSDLEARRDDEKRETGALIALVYATNGPTFRIDGLTDEQLCDASLKILAPKADFTKADYAYKRHYLEEKWKERTRADASLARASAVASSHLTTHTRMDANSANGRELRQEAWRNQHQRPYRVAVEKKGL